MIVGGAFLAWFIPFAVSFFLVEPTTPPTYKPNIYVFYAIMVFLLAVVVYYFYRRLHSKKSLVLNVAHIFLAVAVVLDMGVLVAVFKMSWLLWVKAILPSYLLIFYGFYFLLKKKP